MRRSLTSMSPIARQIGGGRGVLRARRRLVLAVMTGLTLSIGAPRVLSGQLVRGTVRDAATGAPLAGVLIALHRAESVESTDPPLAVTLTSDSGRYAVRAQLPGTFVVTAKRIGARQFASEPFSLKRGDTRQLDLSLDAVRFELPIVTVSAATLCNTRGDDRARIAALWEEARTALTASQLSLRDRLFRATITRYQRTLEPRTLNIRSESRNERRGVTERAFISFPAESLATLGYARSVENNEIEYFAPDDRVLLSDAFVRDHCFALAREGERGQVGITFTPTRDRKETDIAGTIWLDARTYELRRVAFRYTRFPLPVDDERLGGEVHFMRLDRGAWLVSRWFVRVPTVEVRNEYASNSRVPRIESERPVIVAFNEDGGFVVPDDDRGAAGGAVLTGRVVDSTGRVALLGARVSIAGLQAPVAVTREGGFRIAGLLPGNYTLVVEHPGYARLGLLAGEQVLEIEEGKSSMTLLQAIDSPQILRQLCGYDEEKDGRISMRLIPPVTATDAPTERRLRVTWPVRRLLTSTEFRVQTESSDHTVDAHGGVTVCGLPALERIDVEERGADATVVRRWVVRSQERGLQVVELQR